MSYRTQENVFAGILLLFFVGMLWMSYDYGPRARLVPVPISIICIVMIVVQIVVQNLRSSDELTVDALELISGQSKSETRARQRALQEAATPETITAAARPETARERFTHSEFGALAMVLSLLGLFLIVGPIPAVFFFCLAYFTLSKSWGTVRSLVYAFLCAGGTYMMFGYILRIQLNRGLLAPYISQIVHF